MGRMSASSPSDLAVAFRSVPRRLAEATSSVSAAITNPYELELRRELARSAELLRTSPDASSIADAIDAIPADEWDESLLDELRGLAVDIGRTLRTLTAAAEAARGGND